jgi:hypothetical protein
MKSGAKNMNNQLRLTRISASLISTILLVAAASTSFAADKCDNIAATAMGSSTQLGKIVNIKLLFCEPSTPEDQQILVDAFKKGKNQGLTKALEKMSTSGRISLPSTVGYDLAYVRVIPTSTGRQIRWVTNRKIAFGEVYNSTRSKDYSLTAGQLDLNDKDKTKSTGTLYPATQLKMSKTGELTWEVYQNPWKLQNIIDWGNKNPEAVENH